MKFSEDFRLKISKVKQEINQIKKIYDERLLNLNQEHKQNLEKLHEEHQLEIDNLKSELKQFYDIETEASNEILFTNYRRLKT